MSGRCINVGFVIRGDVELRPALLRALVEIQGAIEATGHATAKRGAARERRGR